MTRRVMAEPKAMVVVLMLVAEMVMARMVVKMGIAENQMGWGGGRCEDDGYMATMKAAWMAALRAMDG